MTKPKFEISSLGRLFLIVTIILSALFILVLSLMFTIVDHFDSQIQKLKMSGHT